MRKVFYYLSVMVTSAITLSAFIGVHNASQKQNTLKEVKIGNQVWMTENLSVDKFRNGDLIPLAKTQAEWIMAGDKGLPAWCFYDNNPANGEKYGKLYNWYAVNDHRGLAPTGWHIPSDIEWTQLTDNLGGDTIAGAKMKSIKGWDKNGNGTNESGFSGLPSGNRSTSFASFNRIGENAYWWSSSEDENGMVWDRSLSGSNGNVSRDDFCYKDDGYSVRCLRD